MRDPSADDVPDSSYNASSAEASEHAETAIRRDDDEQQSRPGDETNAVTGPPDAAVGTDVESSATASPSGEDTKVLPQAPLPTNNSPALPPVPDPDSLPVVKLKPRRPRPPKKGILKPPSTAPAHSSRFSFRRDILQPLQYSRLAGGVVPVASGLPSSVAVGEAMNSAAATAGGWLKRLGQAAGVAAEGVQQHQQQHLQRPEGTTGPTTSSRPASTGSPSSVAHDVILSREASATNQSPAVPNPASPPPPSSQPLQPSLSVQSLKQVRFRMQSLAVVYPINGASSSSFSPNPAQSMQDRPVSSPPSRPPPARHTTFFNDLKVGFYPGPPLAPAEEAETRRRVDQEWRTRIKMRTRSHQEHNGGGPGASETGKEKPRARLSRTRVDEQEESRGWTGAELERLYRECCRTREEPGIERVKRLLRVRTTLILASSQPLNLVSYILTPRSTHRRRQRRSTCRKKP